MQSTLDKWRKPGKARLAAASPSTTASPPSTTTPTSTSTSAPSAPSASASSHAQSSLLTFLGGGTPDKPKDKRPSRKQIERTAAAERAANPPPPRQAKPQQLNLFGEVASLVGKGKTGKKGTGKARLSDEGEEEANADESTVAKEGEASESEQSSVTVQQEDQEMGAEGTGGKEEGGEPQTVLRNTQDWQRNNVWRTKLEGARSVSEMTAVVDEILHEVTPFRHCTAVSEHPNYSSVSTFPTIASRNDYGKDLLPLLPQTDYFSHLSPAQQLQLWRNRVEVAQQIAHLYNNNNRVKLRQLPGAHFAHSPTCRDQMVDLWLEWRSSLGPAAVNYDLHIAHGRIPPLQTVQALRSIDRTSARTVFGLYSLFGIRVPCEVYELNEEFRSIPRRRRRVREVKKLRATGGRKGKGRQIDEEGGEEDERAEDEVDEVDEVEESWALRALSLVDAEEPTASVIGSATGALSLGSIPAEGQDDVGAGDDASLFVYEGLGAAAGKSTRGKAGGVTSRNIGEFEQDHFLNGANGIQKLHSCTHNVADGSARGTCLDAKVVSLVSTAVPENCDLNGVIISYALSAFEQLRILLNRCIRPPYDLALLEVFEQNPLLRAAYEEECVFGAPIESDAAHVVCAVEAANVDVGMSHPGTPVGLNDQAGDDLRRYMKTSLSRTSAAARRQANGVDNLKPLTDWWRNASQEEIEAMQIKRVATLAKTPWNRKSVDLARLLDGTMLRKVQGGKHTEIHAHSEMVNGSKKLLKAILPNRSLPPKGEHFFVGAAIVDYDQPLQAYTLSTYAANLNDDGTFSRGNILQTVSAAEFKRKNYTPPFNQLGVERLIKWSAARYLYFESLSDLEKLKSQLLWEANERYRAGRQERAEAAELAEEIVTRMLNEALVAAGCDEKTLDDLVGEGADLRALMDEETEEDELVAMEAMEEDVEGLGGDGDEDGNEMEMEIDA